MQVARLCRSSAARTVVVVLTLMYAATTGAQTPASSLDATAQTFPDSPQTNFGDSSSTPHDVIPGRRLTFSERLQIYRHSITGFEIVTGPLLGASVNQARNEPPEWGQGGDSFAVRFASGYGRSLISRTIRFGVAAADHEDPRFYASDEKGFWRRTKFAVVHVFVAHTDSGGELPAFSRFAGTYGAAFISNEWYPASRANATHALLRGTTALSASVAWNVFREFWPDIRSHVRH